MSDVLKEREQVKEMRLSRAVATKLWKLRQARGAFKRGNTRSFTARLWTSVPAPETAGLP
jgi:hypothetical protein